MYLRKLFMYIGSDKPSIYIYIYIFETILTYKELAYEYARPSILLDGGYSSMAFSFLETMSFAASIQAYFNTVSAPPDS